MATSDTLTEWLDPNDSGSWYTASRAWWERYDYARAVLDMSIAEAMVHADCG